MGSCPDTCVAGGESPSSALLGRDRDKRRESGTRGQPWGHGAVPSPTPYTWSTNPIQNSHFRRAKASLCRAQCSWRCPQPGLAPGAGRWRPRHPLLPSAVPRSGRLRSPLPPPPLEIPVVEHLLAVGLQRPGAAFACGRNEPGGGSASPRAFSAAAPRLTLTVLGPRHFPEALVGGQVVADGGSSASPPRRAATRGSCGPPTGRCG